jgi:hypothetical protein
MEQNLQLNQTSNFQTFSENGPPGMSAFMCSGQDLFKAIQHERINAKSSPKKPNSYDDLHHTSIIYMGIQRAPT